MLFNWSLSLFATRTPKDNLRGKKMKYQNQGRSDGLFWMFCIPDRPTEPASFSRAHLKTVRMDGNRFSQHRVQGKEISQVGKKPPTLFDDKWPNLFLPSNCGNLVELCKSLSLLLWIGCFKWILTFLKARHGKLPVSSFGSGTPIFSLELQLFFSSFCLLPHSLCSA